MLLRSCNWLDRRQETSKRQETRDKRQETKDKIVFCYRIIKKKDDIHLSSFSDLILNVGTYIKLCVLSFAHSEQGTEHIVLLMIPNLSLQPNPNRNKFHPLHLFELMHQQLNRFCLELIFHLSLS